MQENNNFDTLISKWRRISAVEKIEKKDALESISMSGDSSNHTPFSDHKKEETSLLVPENKASTSMATIGASSMAALELPSDKTTSTEEKQDLIKPEEESKDVTGDGDKIKDDYLEFNDKVISNAPEGQTKDKAGDNVDSVFLRAHPAQKRRPTSPAAEVEGEEEDCGMNQFIVPENKESTPMTITGAGAMAATELPSAKITSIEEKQDLIKPEEESKSTYAPENKVSTSMVLKDAVAMLGTESPSDKTTSTEEKQDLIKSEEESKSTYTPENKVSTSMVLKDAVAMLGTESPSDKTTSTEEKQDLIKPEEESKDVNGGGDKIKDHDLDFNDKVISNAPEDQTKVKVGDNVDSVFLGAHATHKKFPTSPDAEVEGEEEDCGIKCLYYTVQCCDCVLM